MAKIKTGVGHGRACVRRLFLAALLAALGPAAPALRAQGVLERTPNLSGGWTGRPGLLYFHFLHRLTVSDAPERKITAFPNFLLAAPLTGATLLGASFATNSTVRLGRPNELELFGRARPLRAERHGVDVFLQAGYNLGPGSADVELGAARWFGPLRLLAAGRGFTAPYGGNRTRLALAGGAVLRLRENVALAADAATLTAREDGEEIAWGAGLQLGIPFTPHTLSLHVSNALSGTLEGLSRGVTRPRFGFEFTIPLTPARFRGAPAPPAAEPATAIDAEALRLELRNMAFAPAVIAVAVGTTIVWRNADAVVHTVTATDGSWSSGNIAPSGSWARTFEIPGRYTVYCIPHPFMTAEVVVQ